VWRASAQFVHLVIWSRERPVFIRDFPFTIPRSAVSTGVPWASCQENIVLHSYIHFIGRNTFVRNLFEVRTVQQESLRQWCRVYAHATGQVAIQLSKTCPRLGKKAPDVFRRDCTTV